MIIDTSNFNFHNWSVERRVEALRLMDQYVKKHANTVDYDIYWSENYVGKRETPEKTEQCFYEFAEDESKFIKALWGFYITLTTDFSWISL